MKKETTSKKKSVKKSAELELPVYDLDGKKKDTVVLPKQVFGDKINKKLLAQAVRVYRLNRMQGTSKAKTRGEVTGSGVKIYRQKGTGRARHGDRYAPIFVGGGIAFPPQARNIQKSLGKQMKKKALISALSSKYNNGSIYIVNSLDSLKPKTKVLIQILGKLNVQIKHGNVREKVLLTTPKAVNGITLSTRNIANVTLRNAQIVTTYDVLRAKKMIIAKDAIDILTKRLTRHD